MNRFNTALLSALIIGSTFTSCQKDDDTPKEKGAYEHGVFIQNEGSFGNSNASVSFIDSEGKTQSNIFKTVNGRNLGDVFQSMMIDNDDKAYLVVNNSNKVEIVNANTFEEIGVIADLKSPRYIIEDGDFLYITQWNGWGEKGSLKIANKNDGSIGSTIEVGNAPEGLVKVNNEIWIANSTSNTISIVNMQSNTLSMTLNLPVDVEAPKHMVVDSDGDVWVLCSGNVLYDSSWNPIGNTPSYLIEINSSTKKLGTPIKLSQTVHYSNLVIDKNGTNLFYGGGFGVIGIFTIETSGSIAPAIPIVDGVFYGFNLDDEGNIYGAIAPNYSSNGTVTTFDSSGKEIAHYVVGIGPNGVVFSN
ncbi:MAG: hypothetical protein KAH10_02035 [Flavobacteriales bacterium]|nr:hypothetical protein [Flavobacteriales bacterium]